MTETMWAYRIEEWNQPPRPVEVPVPRPGPGQVLVKVAGNGLCHSDLAMSHVPAEVGRGLGWRVPFTLGHEVAGWVEGVGDGVAGVANGAAVALVSPSSCGACRSCLRGQDHVCPHGRAGRGYGRDGGLADFVLAGTRDLIPLDGLDPVTAGPLTDAGATSYHAVKRVLPKLVPGSTAVVIGVGGLGAFAVQFLAALSPAHIVAVDTNPARLDHARRLGAHEGRSGVHAGTADVLTDLAGGRGAEAVLDVVGSDATIAAGLAAVRPAGAFALVGAGGGGFAGPWFGGLPRDADVFTFQGSTIADAHEVVALAEGGRIQTDADVFTFDRVAEAYEALASGTLRGRAVVTPDGCSAR